jgi:hypothetical protein
VDAATDAFAVVPMDADADVSAVDAIDVGAGVVSNGVETE